MTGRGRVYLVGAGPGAPDLITLRGLHALEQADLILCDHLLPDDFLAALAIPEQGRDVVRLGPGDTRRRHDEIVCSLIDAARAGRVVVRLKNGDPFVFGRARLELEALTAAGIPCEVVPGASAGTAAPAIAGMQLTAREHGRSVAFVTARRAGGPVNDAMPRADSLVIFMGAEKLPQIVAFLRSDGWPPETPAAVLQRATLAWERRIHAPLAELEAAAKAQALAPPAIVIIGRAALRETNPRPTILFCGADPEPYRVLGNLIHWPALRAEDAYPEPDEWNDTLTHLASGRITAAVFAGAEDVRRFALAVRRDGRDMRVLARAIVVARGEPAAARLARWGVRADSVLPPAGCAVPAQALQPPHPLQPLHPGGPGDRRDPGVATTAERARRAAPGGTPAPALPGPGHVLLLDGAGAAAELQADLTAAGAAVTRLALFALRPHPDLAGPLPPHDAVYFTSPAEVECIEEIRAAGDWAAEVWCADEATRNALAARDVAASIVSP